MIYRVKTFPLKFYKIKLHNMFIIKSFTNYCIFPLLHYYKNKSPTSVPPAETKPPNHSHMHARKETPLCRVAPVGGKRGWKPRESSLVWPGPNPPRLLLLLWTETTPANKQKENTNSNPNPGTSVLLRFTPKTKFANSTHGSNNDKAS